MRWWTPLWGERVAATTREMCRFCHGRTAVPDIECLRAGDLARDVRGTEGASVRDVLRSLFLALTALLPGGLLVLGAFYFTPRLWQRLRLAHSSPSRVTPRGGLSHDENHTNQ